MSTNIVVLQGNLGNKPETRQAGKSNVTTFSLATNEGWGDKKKTNWHNIEVWGDQGDRCAEYLDKGSAVTVTGRLDYQSWEGDDGTKKYKTVVVAANYNGVDFVGGGKAKTEDTGGGRRRGRSKTVRGDGYEAQV